MKYGRPTWLDGYLPSLLVRTYASWRDDRTIRLGAGLAYYGLFSLSSILAVALGLFRIIGRSAAVNEALAERLDEFLGSDAQVTATDIMDKLNGSAGTQLGLIGFGSLLVTGSLFFLAMEDAFNQIWREPVRVGLRSTIRRRLVSLLVLLGAATALVVAFTLQAATSLLEAILPGSVQGSAAIAALAANAVGWAVLVGAVLLLFRYLPPHEVAWRPAIAAALVTGFFLTVGSALIGWYLRTAGASSVVGVVSTPLAVLVWIYYEAQILLAGAQLTKNLDADHHIEDEAHRLVEPEAVPSADDERDDS